MKLEIDRSIWRCGGDTPELVEKFGTTKLLNNKGKMCCLGILGSKMGIPNNHLIDQFEPHDIKELYPDYYDLVYPIEDEAMNLNDEAMSLNDDKDISNEEREDKLTKLFKTNNIEITFIGEYDTSS